MIKRVFCILFTAGIALTAVGSSPKIQAEISAVQAIEITIPCEESYAISDGDVLETSLTTTYTSTDRAVADLREGKFIYGSVPGKATLTVNNGTEETTYAVTVTANGEENSSRSVSSYALPENSTHIGCGFNVLKTDELNETSVVNADKPLLDWEKVYNSGNLI